MKSHKTVNSNLATMKPQISQHTCSFSSILFFFTLLYCISRYSTLFTCLTF